MKIYLTKNFDDFDDYVEQDVEQDNVGKYLYEQEKLGWKIDTESYTTSELILLLSLKSDYLFTTIINNLRQIGHYCVERNIIKVW